VDCFTISLLEIYCWSASERSLKIDHHLVKLEPKILARFFLDTVYITVFMYSVKTKSRSLLKFCSKSGVFTCLIVTYLQLKNNGSEDTVEEKLVILGLQTTI